MLLSQIEIFFLLPCIEIGTVIQSLSMLCYNSSLQRGIDIHLGPPRPLDNSLEGIMCSLMPCSSNNLFVT